MVNKPSLIRKTAVTSIAVNLIGIFAKTLCHSTNTSNGEYLIEMVIPHFDLLFEYQFICSHEHGFTRNWKNQQKRQFIQGNETLNDSVIGCKCQRICSRKEGFGISAGGYYNNPERCGDGEISACQNQIIGNSLDGKIRKAVDNAVKTAETRKHDAILTAMDNVVTPPVELAVRSITASSGHGTNSALQNQDRRDSIGNTENTPLKSVFSQLELNIDQDRIDETHDNKNSEDGDFPALILNYDWQVYAHRSHIHYAKKCFAVNFAFFQPNGIGFSSDEKRN